MKRKCQVVSLQATRALDSLVFWTICAVIKNVPHVSAVWLSAAVN